MQLIKPYFKICPEDITDTSIYNMIKKIENKARKCYQTDNVQCNTLEESAEWIKNKIIKTGHHSVLEHGSITVDFVFDRGVGNELTRHRTGIAISQSSTRYCNYSKNKFNNEIQVIQPFFFDPMETPKVVDIPIVEKADLMTLDNYGNNRFDMTAFDVWFLSCLWAEWGYKTLTTQFGRKAEEARGVLPLSLKTDIGVTANIREWRHILNLRAIGTTGKPHPQIQEIMLPLLNEFKLKIPGLFDDI